MARGLQVGEEDIVIPECDTCCAYIVILTGLCTGQVTCRVEYTPRMRLPDGGNARDGTDWSQMLSACRRGGTAMHTLFPDGSACGESHDAGGLTAAHARDILA